jgi:hypothetical protein
MLFLTQVPEAIRSSNHLYQSQHTQFREGKATYYYHVITVYTRRHRRTPQPTTHKLQQRHLCRSILHSHSIRLKLQIRLSPNISSIIRIRQQRLFRILEMRIQNLLGKSEVA